MNFLKIILGLILITNAGCLSPEEAPDDTEDNMSHHHAKQKNSVGNTALNEKDGWSNSGKLTVGNGFDPITGPSSGVPLQATFTDSDVYTAQFLIGPPPFNSPFGGGEFVRARAEVTWSVEGNFVRRVIDVVNGASISGVGQSVKIKIFDDSVYSPAHPAIQYDVSVSVARGNRSSVQQPPVFSATPLQLAAGAQTGNIPIPQNAGVISVMLLVSTITTQAAVVVPEYGTIVAQVTPVPFNTTLRAYDPRDYEWVPVAPGADHLLIAKDASTPILFYTAIFGIDG